MKNGYKLGLAAVAASIALVGCGGGSSSSTPATVTGEFVDAYVAGLNYACASSGLTGVTDEIGTFTCRATDDNVTFSIGSYVIGSSTATSGIVTPYSLYPDNEVAAIDVAQLLQTLDSDEDGVITIPEDFTALDDVNATPGDTEANFEDEVEAALTAEAGETVTLVTENTAQDSMDENILLALLGGKTLYQAEEDVFAEKLVFDTNLTELNATQIAGADTGLSEIVGLTLQNGALYIEQDGHLVLVEATDDYLIFDHVSAGVTVQEKFYFDEAAALAVYQGIILITEEKLSGKTFYDYEEDTNFEQVILEKMWSKMTFSAGTLTRTEFFEVYNGGDVVLESFTESFTVPYTIIDGKIRIAVPAFPAEGPDEVDEPAQYIWLTLLVETDTTWTTLDEEDMNQDGTIEADKTYENVYDLVRPTSFPVEIQ